MNIISLINNIPSLINFNSGIAQSITVITKKVSLVAMKYFGAIRQSGFFMLGSQDLVRGSNKTFYEWRQIGKDEKVTKAFWQVMGGITLLISGIFGLWSSLDYIGKGYVTPFNETLFTAGNIFFLLSSILRLKTFIDDYLAAENNPAKISAMMGVGANLYYIISACLMLYGPPTTFVIVLCSLGTTTSLLQIIYDFFQTEASDNNLIVG